LSTWDRRHGGRLGGFRLADDEQATIETDIDPLEPRDLADAQIRARRISGHGGWPVRSTARFSGPRRLRWLWLANTNYTDPAVLARLGDHFAPLIARGLNPFWIRDDAEHDLFLYVYHLATEENLLRSMGFPYEVSRKAVNFYVTPANRLVAADQPPAALAAELNPWRHLP
jgi:hypothetical protein